MLHGRGGECRRIDELIEDAREGRGGALVVRGEAGAGKSALLGHAREHAGAARVLIGRGVQNDADLPFAALHQLLRPLSDWFGTPPTPQSDALRSAFGLTPAHEAEGPLSTSQADALRGASGPVPPGGTDRPSSGFGSPPAPQADAACGASDLVPPGGTDRPSSGFGSPPAPQADAACGAFDSVPVLSPGAQVDGLGSGAVRGVDRLMVALGVLTVLSEAAGERPVLCLVDDAQWLDRPSADTLRFVADRLAAERVGLVLAVRDDDPDPLPGLPTLHLTGLDAGAAARLMDERHPDLSPRARDRIIAETRGNPLALTELPGVLTEEQRAGDAPMPGPLPLPDRLQRAYADRVRDLPEGARTLLLVAAAEDDGPLDLVLRAAATLGARPADLDAAETGGLVRVDDTADGPRVVFRHPLTRSAVYRGAPFTRRQAAHLALADALDTGDDTDADRDRRAWHLAAAATGPDEKVAIELERSSGRARRRGGPAAAATALERAAWLSESTAERGRRLVTAAEAANAAGDPHRAESLATRAERDIKTLTAQAERDADAPADPAGREARTLSDRDTRAPADQAERDIEATADRVGHDIKTLADRAGRDTDAPADRAGHDTRALADQAERDIATPADHAGHDTEALADQVGRGISILASRAGRDTEAPADWADRGGVEPTRARVRALRATIAFDSGAPAVAHGLLVGGAEPVAGGHPELAASMLIDAVKNGWFANDPQRAAEAARALEAVRLPEDSALRPLTRTVLGLAAVLRGAGPDDAVGRIRQGVDAGIPPVTERGPLGTILTAMAALTTGDDTGAATAADQAVAACRTDGQVGWLPLALQCHVSVAILTGHYRLAGATATEGRELARTLAQPNRACHFQCVLAWIDAIAGREESCRELATDGLRHAEARRIAPSAALARWALGLLELGLGHPEQALEHMLPPSPATDAHPLIGFMQTPDLVEAAVRCGGVERIRPHLERFEEWAGEVDRAAPRAALARCRALLGDGDVEDRYRTALRLLATLDARPFDRARTELLYGEWLRRARRRADARAPLQSAAETFDRLGATPWAGRAYAELRAAGRSVPSAAAAPAVDTLTPQELQVVRLAGAGASNREIGAQLFISPRTVGYHLHHAFPKLGVTSRAELAHIPLP